VTDHEPTGTETTTDTVRLLTTRDMARRASSTLRTVRFYEEEGLITPVSRGEGGQRYFAPDELAKLALALDLREAGLSVHDVRALFALKAGCATAPVASKSMVRTLETQIVELEEKIGKLRSLREELISMVGVITECERCAAPRFPDECERCDVMHQSESPRALKVLWRDARAPGATEHEE
jgi:MerR family copper efflux transcriptional regulator